MAIFIEPKGNLKKFILSHKKKIKKNFLKSKLTNHPPHSTIYYANLKNIKKAINVIENILLNFKPFKITINKTDVFLNDKLTNGDTIYLSVKKNKKLFILQKKIAKRLINLVNKKSNKKIIKSFENNKMKKSQKLYGFPFIGNHWMPHFTIGSIKGFKKSNDFKKYISTKVNFENLVSNVSVWKVSGNIHKRLKIIKFANN